MKACAASVAASGLVLRSVSSESGEEPGVQADKAGSVPALPYDEEAHKAHHEVFQQVQDWETFRQHGHAMVDFIADYYASVGQHPVKAAVAPGYLRERLPSEVPSSPHSFQEVLADVQAHIMPGVTHWQHKGFLAYFPANTSVPGLLGDMLSGMFNVIGFSWVASPACTELEAITLDWLHGLLGLPEHFASTGAGGGVIQGTASEATAVALLAAKARAQARRPQGVTEDEWASRFVVYTSSQAHSSVKKAAMIAGIALDRFRALPTTPSPAPDCLRDTARAGANHALTGATLQAAVDADVKAGLVPIYACATLGSTSTGAFDDIEGLGRVAKAHDMWLHVDGAWAGSALVCPEYRPLAKGMELADSFDFNPHKWLLTNFDCSAMWVADKRWLLQALSLTPEYLRSAEYEAGDVQDYRDWQVPLGRRFRSLKLFFVLRMFGADALRAYIREHCTLAQTLTQLIAADTRFELTAPTSLSLVCFRVAGDGPEGERSAKLLEAVNATGRVFAVHTKVDGQYMIRLAIGNPRHDEASVRDAWGVIAAVADEVLGGASDQAS